MELALLLVKGIGYACAWVWDNFTYQVIAFFLIGVPTIILGFMVYRMAVQALETITTITNFM